MKDDDKVKIFMNNQLKENASLKRQIALQNNKIKHLENKIDNIIGQINRK